MTWILRMLIVMMLFTIFNASIVAMTREQEIVVL
nr:MAG TPA: hypothetical protein [Caudoviricetes sp.]